MKALAPPGQKNAHPGLTRIPLVLPTVLWNWNIRGSCVTLHASARGFAPINASQHPVNVVLGPSAGAWAWAPGPAAARVVVCVAGSLENEGPAIEPNDGILSPHQMRPLYWMWHRGTALSSYASGRKRHSGLRKTDKYHVLARASHLTQSFEAEGRTHRSIDAEALRSLEEAVSRPALAEALPITAQDQVWHWIENSMGMITNVKHAGAPKRLTIKVEPPGPGPRDQPLQRAPVVGTNALHDAYGSSYSYMGALDSLHKRRKCFSEADETEQDISRISSGLSSHHQIDDFSAHRRSRTR
ncbi:hypothetical protein V493_01255 [Pseudogymnoascus sp. VKM F-4281 (FW-2241)]|nr:hypothetical protein V493_01255 [Pseudogymnoascus sp. VKM F-4281 (FW-2241)]